MPLLDPSPPPVALKLTGFQIPEGSQPAALYALFDHPLGLSLQHPLVPDKGPAWVSDPGDGLLPILPTSTQEQKNLSCPLWVLLPHPYDAVSTLRQRKEVNKAHPKCHVPSSWKPALKVSSASGLREAKGSGHGP